MSAKETNTNFNSHFATNLRNLMNEHGTSQIQLAQSINKTRQTVSQYTNGISEPGYETLGKIADYFDVSVDFLLGRTGDPSRHPCAVDDLGLSAKAIDYIRSYSNPKYSDPEILKSFYELVKPDECLEGLSLLLESGELLSLAGDIKVFRDTIRKNIEISNEYQKVYQSDVSQDFYKLIRAHKDNSIAEIFQEELESRYPELKGTFSLLSGRHFVEYQRNAIVDDFDKMVQRVSNYYEFEEKVKLR